MSSCFFHGCAGREDLEDLGGDLESIRGNLLVRLRDVRDVLRRERRRSDGDFARRGVFDLTFVGLRAFLDCRTTILSARDGCLGSGARWSTTGRGSGAGSGVGALVLGFGSGG